MKLQSVFDPAFVPYGRVLGELNTSEICKVLRETTEKPSNGVIYVPSCEQLESVPIARYIADSLYGGMPVQIGYCNGTNTKLGCLEYHRDSEINITDDDMVFLVACQQELVDGMLDTGKVKAFRAPTGTAVELYATTLHYAPCDGARNAGFRVAVVLPRGTNTEKPAFAAQSAEDRLLWACNKWLVAHPETAEAKQGAFVGLQGENLDIREDL